MEIKDLEVRIEKKLEDIEKTKRAINKFITRNNFSEEDQEVARTYNWKEVRNYADANWPEREDYTKKVEFEDLHRRYSTLAEQETTLQKYQNQLNMQKARIEKEANTEKIPAVVEYLEDLKQKWIDVIKEDIIKYETLYLGAYNKWHEEYLDDSYRERGETYAEHKEKEKALYDRVKMLKKELLPRLDRAVLKYHNDSTNTFDWDKCNEELDKDINMLYWDLVNRITAVAGEIIDANNLSIGAKGNLNGIVKGSLRNVSVETIPAGGYNVQRFHFRTLVKPLGGR